MNPKNISQEDLALFALQLLSPEESSEVITHLEHNEGARAELAQIQGDLALYALSSDLHSPPSVARERLLRRVAKEKKVMPAPAVPFTPAATAAVGSAASDEPLLMPRGGRVFAIDQERAPRRGVHPVAAWAGWAVAAGLGVAAGLQYHQRQILQQSVAAESARLQQVSAESAKAEAVLAALTDSGAMQVELHQPVAAATTGPTDAAKPEAHAAYVADSGSLVFVASHLAPLEAYKTYELWVIPADGRDPIPAGIFKPDARGYANVVMPELPKGVAAKTFGVTIEDEGGAKAPTPPIVLAGM